MHQAKVSNMTNGIMKSIKKVMRYPLVFAVLLGIVTALVQRFFLPDPTSIEKISILILIGMASGLWAGKVRLK